MAKQQVSCSSCNRRVSVADVLCATCMLDLMNESAEPDEVVSLARKNVD